MVWESISLGAIQGPPLMLISYPVAAVTSGQKAAMLLSVIVPQVAKGASRSGIISSIMESETEHP
jgi:hypothetical protein